MRTTKLTTCLKIALFVLAVLCTAAVGKTIYVDDDAAGTNNGSSWENAYIFLQEALASAKSAEKPVEIRVAQGTYRPNQGLAAIPEFDWRTTTFQLINGVTLKGGCAGVGDADPNARDFQAYETVLSGDLNGDDGLNLAGDSENSYHVVTGSGTDNTAVLDGFVITAANANAGTFPDPRCIGGGMYNFTGSPKISNCIFRNNRAFSGGAGMYNSDNSDPLLENCSFIENVTNEDGAGMLNFMGSDPVLTGCDFIGNKADDHAGGMLNVAESNPVLDRCTFVANSAGTESQRHDGGGMFNDDGSPTLTNCLFISNAAGRNGGAMHNKGNSNPIMLNCTFSENQAGSEGDGLHIQDANATLTDCILWANGSDQIYGDANVSYSNVEGGFAGQGNIDANPLFADPNNGDYHLKSQTGRWDPNSESWVKDDVTSPCIDAGDPDSDWSGETWPHGGRINMGAYGGTRQASMSLETQGMTLPRVAYIFSRKTEVAESFDSLLETYGCSTTLISLDNVKETPLDSYDLIVVADDTEYASTWDDPDTVAAIEDSGKPVVGLGEGGYDFFGRLELAIGYPNGAHGSQNSIEVIDPNCSLFSTPYSIEIPEDRALQLYTETEHVGLYLWPIIP
ncbi:MAG: right-handed parallel beta-helix repeat-containing protein, partial [Sedimentisphaerales bacterium]